MAGACYLDSAGRRISYRSVSMGKILVGSCASFIRVGRLVSADADLRMIMSLRRHHL
jgi:hypothetical protein